jgi:hypothetical protein
MVRARWPIAVTVLFCGFVVTSCAYQRTSTTSLNGQQELLPSTAFTEPLKEGRIVSGEGKESDCVLTTPNIHLWCNGIARYY